MDEDPAENTLSSDPGQQDHETFNLPNDAPDSPQVPSHDEGSNHSPREILEGKSDDNDQNGEGQTCKVCGDNSVGSLFGSVVCVPCKTFFLRYGSDHQSFKCKYGGNCVITPINRTRCKYCRYQKCSAIGMWKKVRPAEVQVREGQQPCVVCGDIANGVHFGAITCEGCKKFFRRGLVEHDSYSCKNEKRCPINPQTRNSCRYCRYQKCVMAGMSREAIQMGRPSKMKSEALRFLRINRPLHQQQQQQNHRKPKKRNSDTSVSTEVIHETELEDEEDGDGKEGHHASKKSKSLSTVDQRERYINDPLQMAFQRSPAEPDHVLPVTTSSHGAGEHKSGFATRQSHGEDCWDYIGDAEGGSARNGFKMKRSCGLQVSEHLQGHLCVPSRDEPCGYPASNVGRRHPSDGAKEGNDLHHLNNDFCRPPIDRGSSMNLWFSSRVNESSYQQAREYSISQYKSGIKSAPYHGTSVTGNDNLREAKFSGLHNRSLDTRHMPTMNGGADYSSSGREYFLGQRLTHRIPHQLQDSKGGNYQNPYFSINKPPSAQNNVIHYDHDNNNNHPLRSSLTNGVSCHTDSQFSGTTYESSQKKFNSPGWNPPNESVPDANATPPNQPARGEQEGNTIVSKSALGTFQGVQSENVSNLTLLEENQSQGKPEVEGHSREFQQGRMLGSSSSSSSSLLTSLSHMNIHASRMLSSTSLCTSTAARSSRLRFSSPTSTASLGCFSRQQSPVLAGDRSSPYSSVMMLLSSCQLFNEASKNPFHAVPDPYPSSAVEGPSDHVMCNSSVEDYSEEEANNTNDKNAHIVRFLDSPEQSRITESYWLRHDELPDESLMLNDKHFDVINQIVLAYEKFLQCGTNINVTLKKELESWNLHSQVPLQGSISLPEWIQVKVIPVYTYTSITYCKSLPGFLDLPLTDQATLIRLGQTQSRIMLAAIHWFDPQKRSFEDFLSWRPLDLFKQRLISYAEKIQKLQLDFIESALLNALIVIAADYPGLENPTLINQLRQRILLPFRAYTTAKFGTPNHRLERLFRHIPETRQLGFLHYKMTMKASLKAEEVEKQGE